MNLHIGQQTAGVINNAAGNMSIYGGQQGTVVTDEGARQAVRELQSALGAAALDRTSAVRTHAQIAEISTAIHAPQPDKSRVADMLKRLTKLLAAAGSLTTASAAIIGPLQTLASWLGALGTPILRLLPG